MKYFISQPIYGKSTEEIKCMREHIENAIRSEDQNAEFIDSYVPGCQDDTSEVWQLGRMISLMHEADKVVFAPGWENYLDCRIQHICAKEYRFGVID